MDITLAPERFADQSALAEGVTLRVRDKLGASLTLASRYLPGGLLVDYYSLRGKLCTVRFFLPERVFSAC